MNENLYKNLYNLLISSDKKNVDLLYSILKNNHKIKILFLKRVFKNHDKFNEIDFDNITSIHKYLNIKERVEPMTCICEYLFQIKTNENRYEIQLSNISSIDIAQTLIL